MPNRAPDQLANTCTPWATEDDLCAPCADNDDILADPRLPDMLQAASNILFRLTGRQFPGLCESTVRPCSKPRLYTLPYRYTSDYAFTGWLNSCGCNPARCGCKGLSEIRLSRAVQSIDEVIVDGVTLTDTDYRVDDYNKLVRLGDERWPCCPNLLAGPTEAGSFIISYTHGQSPPVEGVMAAASLACQLILACTNSDQCKLPARVQSVARQGVTIAVLDPLDFFDQGRTGLTDVDMFIKSVNPRNRTRNAAVYSPDIQPRFRKTDTTSAGS